MRGADAAFPQGTVGTSETIIELRDSIITFVSYLVQVRRRREIKGKAMVISSRTPEGRSSHCPLCGSHLKIEPSEPPGDAPCPNCGHLLWFVGKGSRPTVRRERRALKSALLPCSRSLSQSYLSELISHFERLPLDAARTTMVEQLKELGASVHDGDRLWLTLEPRDENSDAVVGELFFDLVRQGVLTRRVRFLVG